MRVVARSCDILCSLVLCVHADTSASPGLFVDSMSVHSVAHLCFNSVIRAIRSVTHVYISMLAHEFSALIVALTLTFCRSLVWC